MLRQNGRSCFPILKTKRCGGNVISKQEPSHEKTEKGGDILVINVNPKSHNNSDIERHVEANHEGMMLCFPIFEYKRCGGNDIPSRNLPMKRLRKNESIWGNNWFWDLLILVVNVKKWETNLLRPLEELSAVGMIEEWEKRIYWTNMKINYWRTWKLSWGRTY